VSYRWFDDILRQQSSRWLVTGAAGFIGSHLVESLLAAGQEVVGLDNFASGKKENLLAVEQKLGPQVWQRFQLIEGDVRSQACCVMAAEGCQFILHQAALASVPLSLAQPDLTHDVNVKGFLNVLDAAVRHAIRRVVYASSCSVYGDQQGTPLSEACRLKPLSPYAASKACDEQYARAFFESYGLSAIGLRYFNVYGERQDPQGAYAAVIPRWVEQLRGGEALRVYGDGENTRDFVHISTVVAANISAALLGDVEECGVFNVASGRSYSLNQVLQLLDHLLGPQPIRSLQIQYEAPRKGDIRYSVADTASFDRVFRLAKCSLPDGLLQLWQSFHTGSEGSPKGDDLSRPNAAVHRTV
jgi:UDP-N-acetylglucosamine 4-epimerase